MTDPDKQRLDALAQAGFVALRRGDAAAAIAAFTEITRSGRAATPAWLLLAEAHGLADDRAAARAALNEALKLDPGHPQALVMHGELMSRDGDDRAAVSWYERALGAANGRQLPPELIQRLQRADAERRAAHDRFRASVEAALGTYSAGVRFDEALAILTGQAQPMLQEPTSFYYPGLPQIAFYDPADFAWAAGLAAAHPAIAAEAQAVLDARTGLGPYVERLADRPNKSHALLEDPRWSAFHLIKGGEIVAENATRCPATMAAIADLPIPRIAGRSPMVLFSILAPGTHIPPHNGMLNTRLICHLPLIVPDQCVLRVGNHRREVRAGEVLIFDDSIEHEAWNRSDRPRAILLFEIWRPELTAAEREALTVMFESVTQYGEG